MINERLSHSIKAQSTHRRIKNQRYYLEITITTHYMSRIFLSHVDAMKNANCVIIETDEIILTRD